MLIEYINYVSNNKEIKQLLNEYKKEKDESIKLKMCISFEKLIIDTKQVIPTFKLEKEPTMRVYERKLEEFKNYGVLDINTLTLEDEYIMYVIEEKNSGDIAQLYGGDTSKITQKNNYWNIRISEEITKYENIKDMFLKLNENRGFILYQTQQKSGLLSFEKCLDSILKFMKSGEKYLLKEFWRFTEFEKNEMEELLISKNTKNWYRATLAMDFLKENNLVEECDYKKYRVTKLGRKIVNDSYYSFNTPIDIRYLAKKLKKVKIFGVVFNENDLLGYESDEELLNKFILKNSITTNVEEEHNQEENKLEEEIKNKESIINNLKVDEKTEFSCKIKKYESKRKRKNTRAINRKKSKEIKYEISDQSKSNLGIEGEKYLYTGLIAKRKELLEGLEIEDYKSIIFYNIDYDILREDKSEGHGCDIEVILKDDKHIYLEVKTSLDDTEFYTMTYNEYKCSKENKDQYYIIKFNNFKYLNRDETKIDMTVIKNPYDIFLNNIETLKNITFYTQY